MKNSFSKLSRPALIVAALALGGVSFAHKSQEAAQASATETLPSAREIVDRFVDVTQAKAAIENTKSMHVTGKVILQGFGIEGVIEIWAAKPNLRKTRMDLGALGGEVTSGYDGKVAWMKHPMLGAKVLQGSELLQMKVEATYDSVLKEPALYESIETVGRESFEGQDCYKIKVVVKPLEGMDAAKTLGGRTSHEFYSVESGLMVGSKGVQVSDMGDQPYTSIVSDYKQFGQQKIASKAVLKISAQELVITTDSVEYDSVPDEVFVLSKEIQTLASEPPKAAPEKP